MITFTKQAELRAYLISGLYQKCTIGFVPTMGALHAGHLSLMQKSLVENDLTVTSIFVNPTQFNNASDLDKYPRTLKDDLKKIATISDKIIVYAPEVDDVYDQNVVSEHFDYDGLEQQMEGKHRPGHFDGVGTIVKKLFEIVKPTKAYFGEKDFQQLQIIKKMVQKNHMKVIVVGCPIFRETNGLAMSSRNERLSANDKKTAAIIYETLLMAKQLFQTKSAKVVSKMVHKIFEKQHTFKLEYFEIANQDTLLECHRRMKNKQYRAFIAVYCHDVRLIDTLSL